MSYKPIKFDMAFESAVSLLYMHGFYLPDYINPEWKDDVYAICKMRDSMVLGYLCRDKGLGGFVEFEDECSDSDKENIVKILEKNIKKTKATSH